MEGVSLKPYFSVRFYKKPIITNIIIYFSAFFKGVFEKNSHFRKKSFSNAIVRV